MNTIFSIKYENNASRLRRAELHKLHVEALEDMNLNSRFELSKHLSQASKYVAFNEEISLSTTAAQ